MRSRPWNGAATSKSPPGNRIRSGSSSRFAIMAPACRRSIARRSSNRISPPTKKGLAWALPWFNRSSWRTDGKLNVCRTSRAARPSGSRTSSSRPPPEKMRSVPENANVKGPRILIVDDDAAQRSLLDSFLQSQGFDTVPVASGKEALEALRDGDFSMMISDVRMPGISGLETLRQARQEHTVLPVLLVTGYADIREAVGAMRDGAVNYLAKPIDLDELLASVRQATGISKAAPMRFTESKQLPAHVIARSPLMQALFR